MTATKLLPDVRDSVNRLTNQFELIPADRVEQLLQVAQYVVERKRDGKESHLNFICTHNSRRSHISQIWASVAAAVYGHDDVHCYSGGTEVTAFNANAIAALERAGFSIEASDNSNPNPRYIVAFADALKPLVCYSKLFDDEYNPGTDFAAVMTCSDADANCPYIPGAYRISLPFVDPKYADGTADVSTAYDEAVRTIGRQLLYIFSMVSELA